MNEQCRKRGIRERQPQLDGERRHVINPHMRQTAGIISVVVPIIILGCSFTLV